MTRLVWAPQAIADVEAIRAYVARDSSHYANFVVERILASVTRLESHPLQDGWYPRLMTSHYAKSSTAATESCIA